MESPTQLIGQVQGSYQGDDVPAAEQLELSVVMPCLNEAETLAVCIDKARETLDRERIAGEVVIADNGSTDGSQAIAAEHGARVVQITSKGYGNALRGAWRPPGAAT